MNARSSAGAVLSIRCHFWIHCLLWALVSCDTSVELAPAPTSARQETDRLAVERFLPSSGATEVGPRSVFTVVFTQPVDLELSGPAPVRLARRVADSLVDLEGDVRHPPGSLELEDGSLVDRQRVVEWRPDPATQLMDGDELVLRPTTDAVSVDGVPWQSSESTTGGDPIPATFEAFRSPPVLSGDVSTEALGASSIAASWSAAIDNATPEEDLTYELFALTFGERADSRTSAVVTRGETEGIATGLDASTPYVVFVRAVDRLGNGSEFTNGAVVRTLDIVDTEAPVFDGVTQVEPISPTELRVSWSPAIDEIDSPALLRYRVFVATDSGTQVFDDACLDASPASCVTSRPGETELILEELLADTEYFVVVRAVDTSDNASTNLEELAARTPISFSSQVQPIFTRLDLGGCTQFGCHMGEFPSGGLVLETYESLLMGGRTEELPIVVPGEAAGDEMESYILWRIDTENTRFRGPRMPFGGDALTRMQVLLIRRWIEQGAQNN